MNKRSLMPRRVHRPSGPPPTRPIPMPPKTNAAGTKLPRRAIVFVGPMAAGKTSIGKRVAKALGIPFIDTDSRIVQRYGEITKIFETRGEAEFRRIEAEVVAREVAEPGARVVSLGGGALLNAQTREILKHHPVILLMTTEKAVMRTVNLSKRPLLRDDPGAWTRILEERRPLYEGAAKITFRTDQHSKEGITNLIVCWLQRDGMLASAADYRDERWGDYD
ncbi:shikimate kinase [Canibacter zhoujuaniae]|uniref:shikimate kinase n=1 Tax=Canibacter zhoujuaniae TaxID=2708343 RepID=UPI001FB8C7D9|nr:shikimate kinase [Canibacter zhoujuaniae]